MAKTKKSRSKKSRNSYLRKSQAKAALTRAYRKKMAQGGFKSSKGMRQSMAYDVNRSGERGPVVRDRRYLEDPMYYDYHGVDDGSMDTEEAVKIVKNAVRKYGPEIIEEVASVEAPEGDDNYPGDAQAILDFIEAYANRKKATGEPYYKNYATTAAAMRKDLRDKSEKRYSTKKMSRKSYDEWKAAPWDSDLEPASSKHWGDLPTRGKKAQAAREAGIDQYLDEHRPPKKEAKAAKVRLAQEAISGAGFPRFRAEQARRAEANTLTITQIKKKLLDLGFQPKSNNRSDLLVELQAAIRARGKEEMSSVEEIPSMVEVPSMEEVSIPSEESQEIFGMM